MTATDPSTSAESHEYQERLAVSLIDHLGVEGAIRACQTNCWEGVLERIRRQKRTRLTVLHSPDNSVGTMILSSRRSGGQTRPTDQG